MSTLVGIVLLGLCAVALSFSLTRARRRLLDLATRNAELKARVETLKIERDRAYETVLSLSHQVDQLEKRRPIVLHCGVPLVTVPVDGRFVIKYVRN